MLFIIFISCGIQLKAQSLSLADSTKKKLDQLVKPGAVMGLNRFLVITPAITPLQLNVAPTSLQQMKYFMPVAEVTSNDRMPIAQLLNTDRMPIYKLGESVYRSKLSTKKYSNELPADTMLMKTP